MKSIFVIRFLIILLLISSLVPLITKAAVQIENPLQYNTLQEFIAALIDVIWTLALLIAPIMLIIAGFYFFTAAGDPQKIEIAKKIILYTLIGLIIIAAAKGIIEFIKSTFIK